MVSNARAPWLGAANKVVSDFFDEAARSYGDAYEGDTPAAHFFRGRKEIVLEILDRLGGGRVLDLGCGPGLMMEACREKGFTYTGVDIAPNMIAECRRRSGGRNDADFFVASMAHLPFPDESFDVLLCMGALEYLVVTAEAQAVGEMTRVLRRDGLLIIACLNADSLYWMFDRYQDQLRGKFHELSRWARPKLRSRASDTLPRKLAVPFRTFRPSVCQQLLDRAGFEMLGTIFFGMAALPPPLERRLPRQRGGRAAGWKPRL